MIAKTVTPRDGTPVDGYTAGDERVFDIGYACVLDGTTVSEGVAEATTGAPVTVTDVPVGAECAVTGEESASEPGDFADGTYRWDGFEVATESGVVGVDAPATLTVDNRFIRDDTPVPPVTPSTAPTPPAPATPATPEAPAGALAVTGGAPALPIALAGAGLVAAAGIAALMMRRRRARD